MRGRNAFALLPVMAANNFLANSEASKGARAGSGSVPSGDGSQRAWYAQVMRRLYGTPDGQKHLEADSWAFCPGWLSGS
jgi:hypothetical protein